MRNFNCLRVNAFTGQARQPVKVEKANAGKPPKTGGFRKAACHEMWGIGTFGKNGARGRIRTTDTAIFSRVLYQLSYPGTRVSWKARIYGNSPGLSSVRPDEIGI